MRILLAEDEKRMASALTALLRQEKYDVDHMADGASALMALESGIYDIAVLDVMMPEMSVNITKLKNHCMVLISPYRGF